LLLIVAAGAVVTAGMTPCLIDMTIMLTASPTNGIITYKHSYRLLMMTSVQRLQLHNISSWEFPIAVGGPYSGIDNGYLWLKYMIVQTPTTTASGILLLEDWCRWMILGQSFQ
jgi:hypothetical protein